MRERAQLRQFGGGDTEYHKLVILANLDGELGTILVDLMRKARVMAVWAEMCLTSVVSLRKRPKVEAIWLTGCVRGSRGWPACDW